MDRSPSTTPSRRIPCSGRRESETRRGAATAASSMRSTRTRGASSAGASGRAACCRRSALPTGCRRPQRGSPSCKPAGSGGTVDRVTVAASDEMALVAALRTGDERAFAQLIDMYGAGMRRFALSIVRNAAIADEVVQEAWLGVLRGLERFEGRAALKTWIFRIVANT